MDRVVVIGAGVAGLSVAAGLAGRRDVTVVDRLPAVGGETGYDHPVIDELYRECLASGVRFELGATGLRWSDHRLLLAAPTGIHWLTAEHLAYAGGCRPGTPAEIGLTGARLGGVLSATVAIHLLDAGVRLGREPVVIGETDFAVEVAARLRRIQTRVRVVAASAEATPAYADEWWPGWRAVRVGGLGRVRELEIANGGRCERLACDAVILAEGTRPLRNVEGALADSEDVTFAQLDKPHAAIAEVIAYGKSAAAAIAASGSRPGVAA
jgi:NADPH-dependent 2,4-dienoyl-CoA reductase/sulfur reductase-like enzyme